MAGTTKPDKLIIFDTTLRDGEQSPGATMTLSEKIAIARALEKLKVDVIEAGFPISSLGDFEAVKAIASQIKDSTVCALARSVNADIDRAGEALASCENRRIHTFIATSPIHMQKKLCMEPDDVIARAIKSIQRAQKYTDNIEFSPEDAGRSEFDFLCRIIEAVIDAGATTINIPDTVGYNLPEQFGRRMKNLIETIPNSDKAIFSTHCHNDLGLAVANSLAGVMNGARQVECTINGLGERAGNAALEEVVMTIRTRQDEFSCDTGIDSTQLVECSKLVSNITGFAVQPNKAIVGVNAFAHESGIHQDGILKNRETYEIMRAEDVGWNKNRIVLGKLSGRNAFSTHLKELGFEIRSEDALQNLFEKFKALADKKGEIFDEDLVYLVKGEDQQVADKIQIKNIQLKSQLGGISVAEVTLNIDGKECRATAEAHGPVAAAFQAIETLVNSGTTLAFYSVNAMHAGLDAQGLAKIQLDKDGQIIHGQGTDVDVVYASVKAYIAALNYL
tara:strand:- start:53284 stop:54798 length:1515 start_codon:yes stop_codon:yes gene_type:complete